MQTLLIALLSKWVNLGGKFETHQHMPTKKLILVHATTGKESGKTQNKQDSQGFTIV
jgi:hypothetical protein